MRLVSLDDTAQTTSHKRGILLAGERLNDAHNRRQRFGGVEAGFQGAKIRPTVTRVATVKASCGGDRYLFRQLLSAAVHDFAR